MEPTIVEKPEMTIAGMDFYGDPFAGGPGWTSENEIGKLGTRFEAVGERKKRALDGVAIPGVAYEVH